ncbi:MAG: sporulation transcription factor Spo0A, partial [Clostridiales bacterium]|nr:sporulation transcription factor Spo0A [Clostridiales bacterium]
MQADKISVIFADDSELLCEIVSKYLRTQPDIELIDIAHDGVEAFEKIKREKPQVAVLDCAMPMLDGLGVLEHLRSEPYRPVCIMLSGLRHDAVTKRAYDLGAEYYIIKPFDLGILAERIRMFRSNFISPLKSEPSPNALLANNLEDSEAELLPAEIRPAISPQTYPVTVHINASASLEEQVTNLLHEIGVPANIRGYRCLRTAILIAVEDLDLLHYVTKGLYPSIGRILNITPSSVERSIRHAIGLVWDHGNPALLDRLFGYS